MRVYVSLKYFYGRTTSFNNIGRFHIFLDGHKCRKFIVNNPPHFYLIVSLFNDSTPSISLSLSDDGKSSNPGLLPPSCFYFRSRVYFKTYLNIYTPNNNGVLSSDKDSPPQSVICVHFPTLNRISRYMKYMT